jgi:hypothetical protein
LNVIITNIPTNRIARRLEGNIGNTPYWGPPSLLSYPRENRPLVPPRFFFRVNTDFIINRIKLNVYVKNYKLCGMWILAMGPSHEMHCNPHEQIDR